MSRCSFVSKGNYLYLIYFPLLFYWFPLLFVSKVSYLPQRKSTSKGREKLSFSLQLTLASCVSVRKLKVCVFQYAYKSDQYKLSSVSLISLYFISRSYSGINKSFDLFDIYVSASGTECYQLTMFSK